MKILSLEHEGYRNLSPGTVYPDAGINVICGYNAQGKTNLLEALWLFTGAHSFRGAKDGELTAFSKESGEKQAFSRLNLTFLSGGREQEAQITIRGGRRSLRLNGVDKRSCGALAGVFCAVIFSPEHLSLVKDGPANRRNFLDGALCQLHPAYVKTVNQYNRILMQRNALLKDIVRHRELIDTIDIWDERLASFGAQIISERLRYVEKLLPRAKNAYSGISSGREVLDLVYRSGISCADSSYEALRACLREKLHASMKDDIRMGSTSCGPHRDDLDLLIGGISARSFGSQGQQRSAVLALKLSEADLLGEACGEEPVILLDDVLSELDESRQDYLLNHLKGRQVFITCCSPEHTRLLNRGKIFSILQGRVSQQTV